MAYTHHRNTPDVAFEPGEIVWANVLNPLENRGCRGKRRPVILLWPTGGSWAVMGLTSNPTYRDGSPRTPVQLPAVLGRRRSYLWGQPSRISRLDVHDHIGWIDEPTADKLARNPAIPYDAAHLLGEDEPGPAPAA